MHTGTKDEPGFMQGIGDDQVAMSSEAIVAETLVRFCACLGHWVVVNSMCVI